MNSITKLSIFALMLFSLILGMTIAYYDVVMEDPSPHLAIQHRALDYTEKDCYTKCDIELIVFGKIVNHE
mgnify:FL=1